MNKFSFKKKNGEGSSCLGSAETNLTSIREDAGLIPGALSGLKDLPLPWAVVWVTDAAWIWHCCGCGISRWLQLLTWPLAWEPPYAPGVALKRQNNNNNNKKKTPQTNKQTEKGFNNKQQQRCFVSKHQPSCWQSFNLFYLKLEAQPSMQSLFQTGIRSLLTARQTSRQRGQITFKLLNPSDPSAEGALLFFRQSLENKSLISKVN